MARIDEAVYAVAERRRDAIAVSDGADVLTYGRLVLLSEAVATNLRAAGVRGGVVGVHLARSARTVAVLLGILRAGAAYLPIDPGLPPARKRILVADTAAVAVVGDGDDAGIENSSLVLSADEALFPVDHTAQFGSRAITDLAYVLYTSGSTGRPKGVAVSHANLANLVRWHRQEFELGPTGRVAQFAALSFDASAWEIWPCLCAGARLALMPEAVRPFPGAITKWLARHKITQTFLPTAVAEQTLPFLVEHPGELRVLLTGGDRLTQFRPGGFSARFVNAYGPTEATVLATAGDVADQPVEGELFPTLGRPIDNVDVHVLDENLVEVPIGATGELYVSGAGVARGYINRPDESERRFLLWEGRRVYRTGDLGRRLATGEFAFHGRDDMQVKIRGQRVELGEVETTLLGAPEVGAAAVVVAPGKDELVAFVVPVGDSDTIDPAALRRSVAASLTRQLVPRVVTVARLPMNASGKVDRAALEDLAGTPEQSRH
ncbi:MAG: amino acid adenylation domain-containing protein [Acidimicrobiia bacterium]